MSDNFLKLIFLIFVPLLGACTSNIKVTGDVPRPLIEPLPLNVELIYTDEFKRYTYEEDTRGRGLRSIAFGEAQVHLFDSIFNSGVVLNEGDTVSNIVVPDLRITPFLLDFQYTAPRETKLNLYEIWLQYRLKIEDANSNEVADWVVKGYGKTPTALLTTPASAFDSATNVALRDVGAQIAIGFRNQPQIIDFLEQRNRTGVVQQQTINLNADPVDIQPEELLPEGSFPE